jgi:hypothetical protein
MSLSYRQRQQLRRIDARLRRSDPELRAKFTMFGRLYEDEDMPVTERAPQARADPDQARFRRAAAWIPMQRPRPGSEGRRGHLGHLGWEPDVDHTDG